MPTAINIIAQRLFNQKLTRSTFRQPEEVVGWLTAMQAQDYPGAKWAIGLRARGVVDDDVDRAFNQGRILRTHVMRPTWHFVAPEDIHWLLTLTAPRVHRGSARVSIEGLGSTTGCSRAAGRSSSERSRVGSR